jgi:hypothetical protein
VKFAASSDSSRLRSSGFPAHAWSRTVARSDGSVDQVKGGDFAAFRPGEQRPWLLIRAIDSTLYVVASEAEEWLGRVRERLGDVRDDPEEIDALDSWCLA